MAPVLPPTPMILLIRCSSSPYSHILTLASSAYTDNDELKNAHCIKNMRNSVHNPIVRQWAGNSFLCLI